MGLSCLSSVVNDLHTYEHVHNVKLPVSLCNFLFKLHLSACVWTPAPYCTHEARAGSPPTMWVPGAELKSSGLRLVAAPSPAVPSHQPYNFIFNFTVLKWWCTGSQVYPEFTRSGTKGYCQTVCQEGSTSMYRLPQCFYNLGSTMGACNYLENKTSSMAQQHGAYGCHITHTVFSMSFRQKQQPSW